MQESPSQDASINITYMYFRWIGLTNRHLISRTICDDPSAKNSGKL